MREIIVLLGVLAACGDESPGLGTASSTAHPLVRSSGAWVYVEPDGRGVALHLYEAPPGKSCLDQGTVGSQVILSIKASNLEFPTGTFTLLEPGDERTVPSVSAIAFSPTNERGEVSGMVTVASTDARLTGRLSGIASTETGATFSVDAEFDAPVCDEE